MFRLPMELMKLTGDPLGICRHIIGALAKGKLEPNEASLQAGELSNGQVYSKSGGISPQLRRRLVSYRRQALLWLIQGAGWLDEALVRR